MVIWTMLTKLLTGGITEAISGWREIKIAKLKQDGETNNIVKDLELESLQNEREFANNAKEVRMATKDHWEMRLAVGLVAIPTSFHYATTVLDQVYNFGWNIQQLPEPLNEWQGTIILSYFGLGVARHGINVVAATLLKRK